MPGEVQQPAGDGTAAADRCQYIVHQPHELLVAGIIRVDGKQVLDEPGLLVDDGQRVVDLVGHPRCQAADGCQLVGIRHLVQGLYPALVRRMDSVDQVGGDAEDGGQDQGDAEQQKTDQVHAGL